MKLSLSQKSLDKAIQVVSKAVSTKSTIAALSGILITAHDGKVVLLANNYEIVIQHTIEADVHEAGAVLVSGRLFGDLIKRMPSSDILLTFNTTKNTLNVSGAGVSYDFLTMKKTDFPELQRFPASRSITLLAAEFKNIHRHTGFAVAEDRPGNPQHYTGIHLIVKEGRLDALGTDMKRLAIKRLVHDFVGEANLILTVKSLSDAVVVFDPDALVEIAWNTSRVSFTTQDTYFETRLISGKTPDFERVIPREPVTTITIDREAFLDALERLSLIGMKREKDFVLNYINLVVTEDKLLISSQSNERGTAWEELSASIDGEPMEIIFNGSNIIECIKILTTDKVIISLTSPYKPALLTSDSGEEFLYVFTPIPPKPAAEAV